MSTDHDLARITRWLEESRAALPPADPGRVLPGVVVRLPVTPQRGATWLRLPRPGVSLTWARAAAMAGLLLLLVLAMALIVVVGAQPAPAPRVGGLAYELGGDIYLADPDGTNPVLVADGDPEAPCGLFGGPRCRPMGDISRIARIGATVVKAPSRSSIRTAISSRPFPARAGTSRGRRTAPGSSRGRRSRTARSRSRESTACCRRCSTRRTRAAVTSTRGGHPTEPSRS